MKTINRNYVYLELIVGFRMIELGDAFIKYFIVFDTQKNLLMKVTK